jgi:folate-binding protein YgfZ
VGDEENDGFVLDVPEAGREGLLAHLRGVLPPRMATVEDVTAETSMLTLVGPGSSALVARLALGSRVEAARLSALDEGEWRALEGEGGSHESGLRASRTDEVWPDAFDVSGSTEGISALVRALEAEDVCRGDAHVWTTLRVEAGRPAYGVDMDDTTIPVEAGIHERAIDYRKGCYTGQEVIVRIRDRGHVNRTLQLVHLGDVEPPAAGTELFRAGADADEKPAAAVTSAVRSPRYGETVALAYARRGMVDVAYTTGTSRTADRSGTSR